MAFQINKVLISDEVAPKCVEILQKNGVAVTKNTKLTKEELLQEIKNYDGLIVRSATKVTADVINAATNLKIIGRAGTGVDNIDCDAATKKGIIVMNTPGGNTLSAAEHTCTFIVALSRSLGAANQSMKAGNWDRKKFMGNELFGKTLGIVGLGRIGKEVALRMQSFGMTTIGFDPIIGADESSTFGVEWMKLEDLWPKVDYVTVHTPLIPQTRNLINDDVFAKCKKGIKVINCARGGIIDEEALLRALDSEQCGGAGLDVFTSEPPKDYSLAKHPMVVATPHLGASTHEAQARVAAEISEQFIDLNKGTSLFGAINAAAMTNALSEATKPWVSLGQNLGKLAASLSGVPKTGSTVQITYQGPFLKNAKSYLEAAVLAGLLTDSPVCSEAGVSSLNLINSPVLGKSAGIQVSSKYEEIPPSGYLNFVSVQVKTGDASATVSGVPGGSTSLLVNLNGSVFASPPSLGGTVIVFKAADIAKILSDVTAALVRQEAGIAGVSIAKGENCSYGFVNLTSSLSKEKVDLHSLGCENISVVNY